VIAAELSGNPTPRDQWAYATLLDLAALVPAGQGVLPAVTARVVELTEEFEVDAAEVRIARAVVDRLVAVAGAGVEQGSSERDRHARVPSRANPLVQEGKERTLPIPALAQRFGRAADQAAGRPLPRLAPWPDGKRWAVAITHDLDVVSGWPLFAMMRWMELTRKGKLGRLVRAKLQALRSIGQAPVLSAIDRILAIESEARVRATWFVLAGEPTLSSWREGDVTYRLKGRPARVILERLARAQHEVGLHGSLGTAESAERLARERDVVREVTGLAPEGVRQHFLRMTPGITQEHARSAGFSYDSTFGFADRTGFRLGTADLVRCWNDRTGKPIDLEEAPLAWMDRTFSKYQGEEDPERWVDDALELARSCQAVEGLWVGLWHPNTGPALGYPDTWPAFARLIQSLAKMDAYIAPLHELVTWRRARRSLRGRSDASGQLSLVAEGGRRTSGPLRMPDLRHG
jgi:hypothetical protein